MKKVNLSYLAIWAGIPAVAAGILAILGFTMLMVNYKTIAMIAVFAAICIVVAIPMILESKMKKAAKALEAGFQAQGFTYQYKFEAHNAVYYIDQGSRMGVVACYNPEFQFVDLSKVTDVRVNDGKFGTTTTRVCCEFRLEGKKVRIATLRVSRGRLPMKDKRVLEAISKAEQLCSFLNAAKANAKG